MSSHYGELRPTSGWDLLPRLGHPSKFQRVSHLGSVTARHSSRTSAKLCSVEHRAPPTFGRAAIMLGIGHGLVVNNFVEYLLTFTGSTDNSMMSQLSNYNMDRNAVKSLGILQYPESGHFVVMLGYHTLVTLFLSCTVYKIEIETEQGLTSQWTHYRSFRGRFLRIKWPRQQCQSTEGSSSPKDRLQSHQVHLTMLQSYACIQYTVIHNTQMNLSTVKWAQWDETQSRDLLGLLLCVCIALCTIVAHNIAQNRPDNFPSYPPDTRYSHV